MQNAEYVRFHWYFVCFGVGLCSAQCSPSVLGSCAQHGFNVGSTWVDWGSSGPCWAQHEPILPTQWDILKTRVFGAISHVWAIFHRLGLCWAQRKVRLLDPVGPCLAQRKATLLDPSRPVFSPQPVSLATILLSPEKEKPSPDQTISLLTSSPTVSYPSCHGGPGGARRQGTRTEHT